MQAFGEGLAHIEFAAGEVEGVACDCYGEMGSQGAGALEEAAVAFVKEVEGAVGDAVFACFGLVCFHFYVVVVRFCQGGEREGLRRSTVRFCLWNELA